MSQNNSEEWSCAGLFSGLGQLEAGLERAGMRVLWSCEAAAGRRAVLRWERPSVPVYQKVEAIDAARVARPRVLAGGFPCQDVSDAGQRLGIEGLRSGLWAHFARLIGEFRPEYVIVENVPGLLARGMGRVLGDLAASGFDAEWDVLPAAAFGAPHLRARIWLLAYPRGQRAKADVTVFAGRPLPDVRTRWPAEPGVPRVDDGVPPWLGEAVGDSLVSQIAEYIGRRVIG
jgi:DNA (cytosine-5)-methyltransferase 1